MTHVIDFTPGSGALAIAASGAFNYEGIAMNESHRDWLDTTLDRCVMHIAGKEKGFAKRLGGDEDVCERKSISVISWPDDGSPTVPRSGRRKDVEGSVIAASEDEDS